MGRYVAPEGYQYRHRNPWVPPDLRDTPGDWHAELPDYYGICERIDECYGRLLDTLAAEGILEDTIVLFTSDHGSHFRTRNAEYKRSAHESSIRVPAIVRGPGFQGGERVTDPVSLVDFPITLLEAAGIEGPDRMDGQSLVPFLDGDVDWRDSVFIQPMSNESVSRAIRTDRWKYSVHAPDEDRWENPQPEQYVERHLYDLYADPYEQQNLVGHPDYEDVAATLRSRLLERITDVEGESPEIAPAKTRP